MISNKLIFVKILFLFFSIYCKINAQEIYIMPKNSRTRWSSFENVKAEKGMGAIENKGAKGHAFDKIRSKESVILLDIQDSGTINRIWLTINDRSPEMLRSLVIKIFWDGSDTPAVSAPLGDFFGVGLGHKTPFESFLFADPEGRSFLSFATMPFKTSAKIVITNDSDKDLNAIFYDVNFILEEHNEDILYFHTYWNRNINTTLSEDFEILPKVKGKGRFLGTNMGVLTNKAYEETWFGEGEVKIYLDGDSDFPTLVGTGIEDYIGTAYGQGEYSQLYQGSLLASQEEGKFAFYRYHIKDPVYFYEDIRVTVQQIGGAPKKIVKELLKKGAPLIPISIDRGNEGFFKLLEDSKVNIDSPSIGDEWVNFYRRDDVSATAYFYLNSPTNELPILQPREIRVKKINPY